MRKTLIVSIFILLSGLLVNFSEAAQFSLPEGFLIFKLGDTRENVTKNVTETYGVRNNAVTSVQEINYAPDFIVNKVRFTRPSELILGAKVESIECMFRNNQLFHIEILFRLGTPSNFNKDLSDALKSRYKEFKPDTPVGSGNIGDTEIQLWKEDPGGFFSPSIDPKISVFLVKERSVWREHEREWERKQRQNIQDQL